MTTNRKRFNIDVSLDENGVVDVSLSTNQDFRSNLAFDDLVKMLEGVLVNKQSI